MTAAEGARLPSAVRLVAQIRLQAGAAPPFLEAWAGHVAEVAGEPGCLQYELFQSVSDVDRLTLLEHWASREDFEAHWERERQQAGGPGVPAVAHLIVDVVTEMYDRQHFVPSDDGGWRPEPD